MIYKKNSRQKIGCSACMTGMPFVCGESPQGA